MNLVQSLTNFLKKIKNQKFLDKIEQGMKEICENPYIGERKKGPLKDVYGHKIYHVRAPYVISYKIFKVQNETQKGIEFFMIEGRGGDYRRIERYAKTSKHN